MSHSVRLEQADPSERPTSVGSIIGSRWLQYALCAAVLLLVPAVFTRVPFYTMSVAVLMIIQALAALGLIPLTGHAGQISLGQAAFFAIGGYASALLTGSMHLNAVLAIVIGAALSAATAFVLGTFIFRAQGHYLVLATLSFGLVVSYLANQLPVTGAANGISDIGALTPFGHPIDTDLSMYYLVAAVLLVACVAVHSLLRSPIGAALTALGDSPVATAAAGISVASLRRGAFTFAAVLSSLAGSFYAHWSTYLDAGQAGILNSIQLLIIATIGGSRTVWGAPVGAFVVITCSEATKTLLPIAIPQATGNFDVVTYGIALIVILIFLPQGVCGGVAQLVRRLSPSRISRTHTLNRPTHKEKT